MPPKKLDLETIFNKLEEISKSYKTPVVDLIEAQTKEPWKVLVATILSARTNDATTAEVTTRLFKKVKDIQSLQKYSIAQLEKLIFPVGFYRNKAKYLKALPASLNEQFDGVIPETIEELIKLPGVGRKTANLVVAVGFHKPAICVDTHVHRITNIWGYVKTKTPLETEMALRKKLDKRYWLRINQLLVAHGQSICRPISPICSDCVIEKECPKRGVIPRKTGAPKPTATKTNALKLISWNVNGIRAVEKKGFVDFVKTSGAEVIAIQETKAQKEQLEDSLITIDGYKSYWHSAQKKGYSGVAVYTKTEPLKVHYGIGIDEIDFEGRVITLEYSDYFLVNCYFPNAQHELKRLDYKLLFNKEILSWCNKLKNKKTVALCGDYNVAHKAIDLKNPKSNEKNPGYCIEERNAMDHFINSGYIDTFRKFNHKPDQYSWWSYRFSARQKNIGWRIDYFCVDKESDHRIVNAEILSDVLGSDHCPVTLELGPI